jgi:hypothetical protein
MINNSEKPQNFRINLIAFNSIRKNINLNNNKLEENYEFLNIFLTIINF